MKHWSRLAKLLAIIVGIGLLIPYRKWVCKPLPSAIGNPSQYSFEMTNPNPPRIRVLCANVGSANLTCRGPYLYNLCLASVEERISAGIARLQPDVIVLQEVTDPGQCEQFSERNPDRVCFNYTERTPYFQIRRLVGPDYTIVCDARNHFECVAVHVEAGTIDGCPRGRLCRGGAMADVPKDNCDPGFTVSKVTTTVHGVRMAIVNVHSNSRSIICRKKAFRRIFETVDGKPPLASEERNLILGDMNVDPFCSDDASARLWIQYVGGVNEGKPYHYHSGPAEHIPPYPTYPALGRVLDHVISNFAEGICLTLGESPGTERLDGGSGMDHRALLCDLTILDN